MRRINRRLLKKRGKGNRVLEVLKFECRVAYEMKLQEEKRLRKQIDLELESMNKQFEERREDLETDAEREIDELRERNENEIKRISEEMRKNESKL